MLRRLGDALPGAERLAGTAESIPLDDASVDAVLVAEAFHWFATPTAVAEIARVLRPDGGLGLLWNLNDWDDEPWLEQLRVLLSARLAPVVSAVDRSRPETWRGAFDGLPLDGFKQFEVRHEVRTDIDGLVGLVGTWSHARALDDAERTELIRALESLVRRTHPSPDDVVIRFLTQVHWTRLR
jgi:SAM-dependent methyltransferase